MYVFARVGPRPYRRACSCTICRETWDETSPRSGRWAGSFGASMSSSVTVTAPHAEIRRLEQIGPRVRALVLTVSVEPLASASLTLAGAPPVAEFRDRPDRLMTPPKHSGTDHHTPS